MRRQQTVTFVSDHRDSVHMMLVHTVSQFADAFGIRMTALGRTEMVT